MKNRSQTASGFFSSIVRRDNAPRFAKLLPREKWIIVPGFGVAAFAAGWMTRMSPDVGEAALALPLLLRGLLLLFIVPSVANLTCRIFSIEEAFTHGYRLKNIVRQLTISFATASAIIVEQHRLALHQSRLAESVNPYNPVYQNTLATLARGSAAGHAASEAHALAIASISRSIAQQASLLASLDGFYFLIGVAICGGPFAAWQKQID
ncbi:hypothetical protein HDG37_000404 [Paraburkholderia sp. MM5384-R2]|nr:hypothetical protein [Paraburkholderia sp. MM5384-R2]